MEGTSLAREYYEAFGKAMLDEQFKDVKDRIAVGVAGEGSENFNVDDEISWDHDFEPGFCLWITKEDEREFGFKLERAYAKLPNTFKGFTRQPMNPCGGNRHGVLIIDEFYEKFIGSNRAPESFEEWLKIPEDTLATATNGEVFEDKLGIFSGIRNRLLSMPDDVWFKKVAAKMVRMGLAGQYNYARCVGHDDNVAAQIALANFVEDGVKLAFLMNHEYAPYFKLAFRRMKSLKSYNDLYDRFEFLLIKDNSRENYLKKLEYIESIAKEFIDYFKENGLTQATCNNLDTHAYSIIDNIKDPELRNLNIMIDEL